jgi:hypothetical protein
VYIVNGSPFRGEEQRDSSAMQTRVDDTVETHFDRLHQRYFAPTNVRYVNRLQLDDARVSKRQLILT